MAKRAPKTATPAPVVETPVEGKRKRIKRKRVRLVSTNPENKLWVHAFVDVLDAYGYPVDSDGNAMVIGTASRGGIGRKRLTDEEKAERAAKKAAEKAAFEAMTDEQKLAFMEEKRTVRRAKVKARKERQRNELIEQIKAQILAGEITL